MWEKSDSSYLSKWASKSPMTFGFRASAFLTMIDHRGLLSKNFGGMWVTNIIHSFMYTWRRFWLKSRSDFFKFLIHTFALKLSLISLALRKLAFSFRSIFFNAVMDVHRLTISGFSTNSRTLLTRRKRSSRTKGTNIWQGMIEKYQQQSWRNAVLQGLNYHWQLEAHWHNF